MEYIEDFHTMASYTTKNQINIKSYLKSNIRLLFNMFPIKYVQFEQQPKTLVEGTSVCTDCPKGTFDNDGRGSIDCEKCKEGTFNDKTSKYFGIR